MSEIRTDGENEADRIRRQKQLEPDAAKYQLAAYLVVNFNKTISDTKYDPDLFVAPTSVRWVTGLWLTSLGLALIVALLAILAKQWLEEYSRRMRTPAASHQRWAWRHLMLSSGLSRWQMGMFIGGLPVALHGSLFLFLVGLAVFFWSLCSELAFLVLSATGGVFVFYCISTMAPAIAQDCPTRTPLLQLIRLILVFFFGRFGRISRVIYGLVASDKLVFPYTPAVCNERILAWMIDNLPAIEDVSAAVEAIGSLPIADHTGRPRPHSTEGLLKPVVMRTVIQRAELLLSPDDSSNPDSMYRVIASRRFLSQLHASQLVTHQISDALHNSHAMSPSNTVMVTQYLELVLAQRDYPGRLYDWLAADSAVLETPKVAQYLLALDDVMRDGQASIKQRLKIRTRLLCNEVSRLALPKEEPSELRTVICSIMLDLGSAHAKNYPQVLEETGHQMLPELHALLCLSYVLPVYAAGLPAYADVYADLRGTYETSIARLSSPTTSIRQLGSRCTIQCLQPLLSPSFTQTEWSIQFLRGACALWLRGMNIQTPWSWDVSAVLSTLLASLSKAADVVEYTASAEELATSIVENTVKRDYRTEQSSWNTAGVLRDLEEDVSTRTRISLLHPMIFVRGLPTSAWNLMCSILKPHQRPVSMLNIVFEMYVILHQLHHRGFDVEPMYGEIVGVNLCEAPWIITMSTRSQLMFTLKLFSYAMAEVSESLWNRFVLQMDKVPVNDWSLVDNEGQLVSVADLVSQVYSMKQEKCYVIVAFKDEDIHPPVPDEKMRRRAVADSAI